MEILANSYYYSGIFQDLIWAFAIIILLSKGGILDKPYWFLLLHISAILLLELSALVLIKLKYNTFTLSTIYAYLEVATLLLYLRSAIYPKYNYYFFSGIFVFIIFQTVNALYLEGTKTYNILGIYLGSSVMLLFALISFSEINKKSTFKSLTTIPHFWIVLSYILINILYLMFNFFQQNGYYPNDNSFFYISGIISNLLKTLFMFGIVNGIRIIR